jgi:hypothetical protein
MNVTSLCSRTTYLSVANARLDQFAAAQLALASECSANSGALQLRFANEALFHVRVAEQLGQLCNVESCILIVRFVCAECIEHK